MFEPVSISNRKALYRLFSHHYPFNLSFFVLVSPGFQNTILNEPSVEASDEITAPSGSTLPD